MFEQPRHLHSKCSVGALQEILLYSVDSYLNTNTWEGS